MDNVNENANKSISDLCNEVREAFKAGDPRPDVNELQLAKEITVEIQKNTIDIIKADSKSMNKGIEIVKKLNKLREKINAAKNKGEFDATNNDELKALLDEIRELNLNFDQTGDGESGGNVETVSGIKENNWKYTSNETENLMDSLNNRIKDLQLKNEMKMQTMNRNHNMMNEGYAIGRLIMDAHKQTMSKITSNIR